MAGKISEMTAASTLTGTEMVEVVQAGQNVRTTVGDIAAVAGGTGKLAGINDQTGTAYTLALTDAGKDVRCTNAAAVALTVPPSSVVAFPVGSWILFSQGGAGVVTATPGAGVSLQAANGLATTAKYDLRGLEYLGSDVWRVL